MSKQLFWQGVMKEGKILILGKPQLLRAYRPKILDQYSRRHQSMSSC